MRRRSGELPSSLRDASAATRRIWREGTRLTDPNDPERGIAASNAPPGCLLAARRRPNAAALPGIIGRHPPMIRINRHKSGPRLYLVGRRVHHGPAFGLAAVLCWRFRWRTLAAALGAYAATDWRDFPFTDNCNH